MPYDLKYNSTLQIIEIVHVGILSGKDILESTDEGILLQTEHGSNAILIDATGLETVASITDVFDLPRQYDDGAVSRATRFAVVRPKRQVAREMAQFYDNVCNNRGWRVKQFDTRDEAVEWLTSYGSS